MDELVFALEGYKFGEPVVATPAAWPQNKSYQGKVVRLEPVDPEKDLNDLFDASHGTNGKLAVWAYTPISGPFENKAKMRQWLQWCKDHKDYVFYTVRLQGNDKAVGMANYVSVVPDMRTIEVGFIWYTPEVQRTKVNTESIYLLLREAFENLNYRRVEWKCDSLNQRSREAALRLGFQFEGVFRQHRIVRGRNRDTAWYSMLDKDWEIVKRNILDWLLSAGNQSLTKLNSLPR